MLEYSDEVKQHVDELVEKFEDGLFSPQDYWYGDTMIVPEGKILR